MLDVQLTKAGFYEISWPTTEPKAGATYIRPGRRESVRVVLRREAREVEVYAGDLKNGRLVYRGSAESALNLPLLALQAN